MDRNCVRRFAPDSHTVKGTQHHWQSHFPREASSWVQWWSPSLWVQHGWEGQPATMASTQGIHPYPHETRLHPLLVKLSDYHLHVFSSAALHVWEVLPARIQKAMSLSSFVPHLTTLLYLLQGDAMLTPLPTLLTNVLSHHRMSLSSFCLSSLEWKLFGAWSSVSLGRGQWVL